MEWIAMTIAGRRAGPVVAMAALACLGLLLTAPFAEAQSRDTGAINGVVTDEQGGVLPGATVTLIRPDRGTEATAVTDARGSYRFPAVRRGTYSVVASMDSFMSARQDDVRLSIAQTLRVDFSLKLGSVAETVQVTAIPPLIDVQDSQLATSELSNEVLMNVPTGKSIAEVVKLTPGVHAVDPDNQGRGFSAYGGSDQGIQYAIDGVTINSPEAGETEVSLGFDSVEEISILGIGAPAEYGNYDGVIVNATTKSGSNTWQGLVDLTFEDNDWQSQNTDDEDLQRSGAERTIQTYHFNIGGPLARDNVWYFGSIRYEDEQSPPDEGFAEGPSFTSPRLINKVSWQAGEKQHLTGMLEYSSHAARFQGADDGGFFSPGTTFDNEQTAWFWNANYTNAVSENTLVEVKFGGYFQRQDEIPENGDVPARFDEFEDKLFDNWFGPFVADRERYLVAASVTHYTENFLGGSHDFKFGADWERAPVHTLAGYSGDKYYISQGGEPYLRYDTAGYDTFATPKRFSAYAQDSWDLNERVRLNLGLRLNRWRGSGFSNRNRERFDLGTYYTPKIGLAPRLGITIDVSGDNTAVVKAHYGKYYRQVTALFFSRLLPESDFSAFIWDEGEWVHEFTEVRDINQFRLDPDLRVPFMRQFAVGFEKELARDLSVDITGIYKNHEDFQDGVNLTGEFEEVPYFDEFTGQTFMVFNQLNPGENQFLITNVEQGRDYGQAFKPLTDFDQKRKYFGISATVNKRWSNNWQAQGSYSYGRATGNDDNILQEFMEDRSGNLGSSTFYVNPNQQINATGHLTIDPTHLVKIAASGLFFEGPWEFILGTYVNAFSGNPYNQLIPLLEEAEIEPFDQEIFGEPRGSFRNPSGILVDLKVEKLFPIGGTRASVMLDIFNLFNSDVALDSQQGVDNEDRPFGSVTGLVRPRTWRLGFRLRF